MCLSIVDLQGGRQEQPPFLIESGRRDVVVMKFMSCFDGMAHTMEKRSSVQNGDRCGSTDLRHCVDEVVEGGNLRIAIFAYRFPFSFCLTDWKQGKS